MEKKSEFKKVTSLHFYRIKTKASDDSGQIYGPEEGTMANKRVFLSEVLS